MSLWNHRLDQNTNKNFDSFCPGPFRTEIIKIFVGILVQTKTSKRHFEINWPLETVLLQNWYCQKLTVRSFTSIVLYIKAILLRFNQQSWTRFLSHKIKPSILHSNPSILKQSTYKMSNQFNLLTFPLQVTWYVTRVWVTST